MRSIEESLSKLTNEVIFDVYKCTPSSPPSHTLSPPPTYFSDTTSPTPPSSSFSPPPPLILFLTLDTKEDDPPDKDILFCYPSRGCHHFLDQIILLRGAFLTLSNLIPTISSSLSYTTSSVLVVDGELCYISGHLVGKELLLIAQTGVNNYQVELVLDSLVECLELVYGDLMSAFKSDSSTLSGVLSSILSFSSSPSPNSFLFPALQQLPLSIKTAAQISSHLNQIDAASYSPPLLSPPGSSPSLLSPLGSCLFYKGYLVSSHLTLQLLRAAHLVCVCFVTRQPLAELTSVWKQIYLKEESQSDANLFVLAIGMEHTLLCQVVSVGRELNISSFPDDRVKENCRKILSDIHSSGLLSDCERRLIGLPALTSADVLLASNLTTAAAAGAGGEKGGGGGGKGHHRMTRSSTGSIYSLSTIVSGSLSDSDDDSSSRLTPNKSSSVFHSFRLSLRRRKHKSTSSATLTPSMLSLPLATREPYMLTAGMENHLLYYVSLESGRGLLVSPSNEQVSSQPVHSQLLITFRETASAIHTILYQKRREEQEENVWEEEEEEEISSVSSMKDGNDGVFSLRGSSVIEHGVLVSCTTLSTRGGGVGGGAKNIHGSLANPPILNYWIIGRLFEERELYICYQENMSQSSVEIIFKLLFGSSIF
ncbi:PREDICTED: protein inturned-like [Amphimedon queenslandica]|uniref:CCZ1/INTU/HSP4 first Longin domain-containing protein n=1 Tax=Amphimedon queenslandica TaxID=400682 RepID=A0AAN0JGY5_AMPQE|nr:PREDICTED: protein inturned-like [Amphimedon queenslandica]|eukprot:XP_019856061.1 PREDICTED: protein inturned-like [Amphimedon queenslandica]